jgi:hypothetical protein
VNDADAITGVRAIALDIMANADVNIVDVNDYHAGECTATAKGYGIFPSSFAASIDPEDPDWDSGNYTPLGEYLDYPDDTKEGLDTNGITVEMGSLYEDGNEPLTSGILLEIVLDPNHSSECTRISLALNQIRGAIVLEDGSAPSKVYLKDWVFSECLIGGAAGGLEKSDWDFWGQPNCWCYCRQCRGDIDGLKTGPFWVTIPDLTILKLAYGKMDAQLALVPNGICADLDHKKTGPFRVTIPDLGIFKKYYGKMANFVPPCDQADVLNGYPAPYVGPWNFWCDPTGCPADCPPL